MAINLIIATSYAQNTSLPVGSIPGSADVTSMGAATYNIPIEVVPGTQGVQPSLIVVYNSMANMGILGSQWDLGGLSAITRVGQNTFLDLRSSSVALNYSDRFALDGNRLVCNDPTLYGLNGILYHPEFEDFSKIYSYGTIGNGPEYFLVYRDDGSVAEYGRSSDSRQRLGNSVYSWYVNKITDMNGNYMTFTYGYSGSEVWIDHIDYTGNTAAGLSPYARVSFTYDTYTHIGSTFVAGHEIPQTKLLRTITVEYKNGSSYELVRQYLFSYSEEFPKRLTDVKLMASDSSELNPTVVEWNTLTVGTPNTSTFTVPNMVFNNTHAHFALDFNGDGLSDIVEYNNVKRRVLINQNNTFQEIFSDAQSHYPQIQSAVPADVNGDGFSEVITTFFNSSDRELQITALIQSLDEVALLHLFGVDSVKAVLAGDFCNNGSHQILICYNHNKVVLHSVHVHAELTLNHSGGTFDLIDFDGDGQTEFVMIKNNTLNVYKYNLETMQIECVGDALPFSEKPLSFGDFNGDGISDYLYQIEFHHYACALGNGRAFIEHVPLSQSLISDTISPIVVDINNDGLDDIVSFCKKPNGLKAVVYLGRGFYNDSIQLFFNNQWLLHPYIMPTKATYGYLNYPLSDLFNLTIGNYNSDMKIDFLIAKQCNVVDQLTLYEFNENKTRPQVTKITTGDGFYTQWEQQCVHGYYYKYASHIQSLPYYFDVVKTMRTSGDQPNRQYAHQYQFKDPQYSFRRHSVMGFSTIIRKDSVMNVTDTTRFANVLSNYDWQDVLMPIRKTTKIGCSVVNSDVYTPAVRYLSYNRRKPYISSSVSSDLLTNTMTIQRITLNSEGLPTGSSTVTKDINDANYLTKDSVQYRLATANLSNGAFMTRMDSIASYSYWGNSSTYFTKKQYFSYLPDGKLQSSCTL